MIGSPEATNRLPSTSYTTSTESFLRYVPAIPRKMLSPPEGAEPPFLREMLREAQRPSLELVVDTAPLRHAVHEHLEGLAHVSRELHGRVFAHAVIVDRAALATSASK